MLNQNSSIMMETFCVLSFLQGDDPSVDKKMDADKRGMADYNGDMRRGGRGGGGYRVPGSKDMGPVDMGPYGEKVGAHSLCSLVSNRVTDPLWYQCVTLRFPDGRPRRVRRQRRGDASASRDAPAGRASDEQCAGVTCSSASSVPACSGLLS